MTFSILEASGDYDLLAFMCRIIHKKGNQKPQPYENIHENILAT